MKRFQFHAVLFTLIALLSAGCSWSKKDKEPTQEPLTDYRESRVRSPLEIPPDLSAESVDKSLSVPKYEPQQPAPELEQVVVRPTAPPARSSARDAGEAGDVPNMYIERAGSQRWLVVAQPLSKTWSDAREFLLASGLSIEREDRNLGTLETSWASNYAKGVLRGTQKLFNKYLGSVYSSPSRDKFIVRVEPGRVNGTTEVYISHRGMIEEAVIDNNVDPVRTIWQPVPPDPNIEAEMLSRFMVELGESNTDASSKIASAEKSADKAEIVKSASGQSALLIDDSMDLAWRRVGQTLDRVGFTVDDRDLNKRAYYVRYADPELSGKKPGFFSKMFGKDKNSLEDNIYQIRLSEVGSKTKVDVATREGAKAPDKVVKQIVNLLYEQLR